MKIVELKTSQSNWIKCTHHFAQWTRALFGMCEWVSEEARAWVSLFFFFFSFSLGKIFTTTHVLNRLSFSGKCSTERALCKCKCVYKYLYHWTLLILFVIIATKLWFLLAFTHRHTHTELIASKLTEMRLKIFTQQSEAYLTWKINISISSHFILVSIEN